MSDHRVTCPSCAAVLRLAHAVEPGKGIKCPKCQTVFKVPRAGAKVPPVEDEAETVRPVAAKQGGKARRPAREEPDEDEQEEEDERPVRLKKGKNKAAGSSLVLLLVLGGLGGLVVLGGGTVGVLYATGVIGRGKASSQTSTEGGGGTTRPGVEAFQQKLIGKWHPADASSAESLEITADGKWKRGQWYRQEDGQPYKVVTSGELEIGEPPLTDTRKIRFDGEDIIIGSAPGPETRWQRDNSASSPLEGQLRGRWLLEQTSPLPTNGAFVEFRPGGVVIQDEGDRWAREGKYRFPAADQVELALPASKEPGVLWIPRRYTVRITGNKLTLSRDGFTWPYRRAS